MFEILEGIIHRLSNPTLSMFDNFIIWMNLIGAGVSFYWQREASRIGIPALRRTHLAVATLAVLYVLAYLFLLVGDLLFLNWSSYMRGVSLVVWPVVWTWNAVVSIKVWRVVVDLLEKGKPK